VQRRGRKKEKVRIMRTRGWGDGLEEGREMEKGRDGGERERREKGGKSGDGKKREGERSGEKGGEKGRKKEKERIQKMWGGGEGDGIEGGEVRSQNGQVNRFIWNKKFNPKFRVQDTNMVKTRKGQNWKCSF